MKLSRILEATIEHVIIDAVYKSQLYIACILTLALPDGLEHILATFPCIQELRLSR